MQFNRNFWDVFLNSRGYIFFNKSVPNIKPMPGIQIMLTMSYGKEKKKCIYHNTDCY